MGVPTTVRGTEGDGAGRERTPGTSGLSDHRYPRFGARHRSESVTDRVLVRKCVSPAAARPVALAEAAVDVAEGRGADVRRCPGVDVGAGFTEDSGELRGRGPRRPGQPADGRSGLPPKRGVSTGRGESVPTPDTPLVIGVDARRPRAFTPKGRLDMGSECRLEW